MFNSTLVENCIFILHTQVYQLKNNLLWFTYIHVSLKLDTIHEKHCVYLRQESCRYCCFFFFLLIFPGIFSFIASQHPSNMTATSVGSEFSLTHFLRLLTRVFLPVKICFNVCGMITSAWSFRRLPQTTAALSRLLAFTASCICCHNRKFVFQRLYERQHEIV